jgi:hypothetical protein
MDTGDTVATRKVEVSAKIYPICKNCRLPFGHPVHNRPKELSLCSTGYIPDGPVRELGVLAKGEL